MARRYHPGWEPTPADALPPLVSGRWGWWAATGAGFLMVLGWVVRHDPGPGLSDRGWLTVALAAVAVVLLSVHRLSGVGWLLRVMAEYAVVAVLAVLLATTGAPQPPATHPGTAATTAGDGRSLVTQVRDRLAAWWRWADQQADRHRQPPPTTPAPPTGR
jgi:hypothetical protein